MKKYIKLYALLVMALFVGACEDELGNSFQPIQIVPGEEIQFGAVAGFETSTKDTRTIYGDINSAGNLIEVNWVPGVDCIQIISPHTTGAEVAEYKVTKTDSVQNNGVDNKFDKFSKATALQRIGDAGLQWSNGEEYEFYAMYPSHNQLKEVVTEVADVNNYGLKKAEDNGAPEGTMTGYLPVTQDPDPNNPITSQNGVIKIHPDMRYAYMVAKEYYEVPESGAIENEADKIQLNFESLVTALEFELVVNEIGAQNDKTNSITIMALTLTSTDYDLCGKFCYTFPKGEEEAINKGKINILNDNTRNYKSINMRFGDGIPVVKDDVVKATFFVLPSAGVDDKSKFAAKDLKLTVTYKVAGQPQIKTATIAKEVEPRKYTYFKNVKLPKVDANITGSKWFEALDPDVFVSQVSIPVAANVFANKHYASNMTHGDYRWQQTKDLTSLWNIGVRGFELCCQSNTPVNTSSGECFKLNLDEMPMVAAEQDITGENFAAQLDLLYKLMFEGDEKTKEPLVLICTYASRDDGYNPMHWIVQLFNSFVSFCDRNKIDPDEIFLQLNANTTVEDLYGKIAVIIRPGSDERWAYNTSKYNSSEGGTTNDPTYLMNGFKTKTDDSPYGYTLGIPNAKEWKEQTRTGHWLTGGYKYNDTDPADLPSVITEGDWWNRVLLISDWGMDSWDSWHRRFATDDKSNLYLYATTATNHENLSNDRKIEGQQIYEQYIVNGGAPKTGNYYYKYDMYMGDNTYGTAYIQDMVRVIDENSAGQKTIKAYANSRDQNGTKTVTWVESLSEKKKAIDGLFKISVDRTDGVINKLCINNISGYFPTTAYEYYTTSSSRYNGGNVSFFPVYDSADFKNAGKGGNYKDCAKELTSYVYGILSGGTMASSGQLAEGPWGLVMMDYIGEVDNSTQLVDLIMMNNFRFPLEQKPDDGNGDDPQLVKVTLNGEKVNPEAEVFVTWN